MKSKEINKIVEAEEEEEVEEREAEVIINSEVEAEQIIIEVICRLSQLVAFSRPLKITS